MESLNAFAAVWARERIAAVKGVEVDAGGQCWTPAPAAISTRFGRRFGTAAQCESSVLEPGTRARYSSSVRFAFNLYNLGWYGLTRRQKIKVTEVRSRNVRTHDAKVGGRSGDRRIHRIGGRSRSTTKNPAGWKRAGACVALAPAPAAVRAIGLLIHCQDVVAVSCCEGHHAVPSPCLRCAFAVPLLWLVTCPCLSCC